MRPRPNRRLLWLFVVAVIVPCLVLIALSLRMIGQERELNEKRRLEDERRLVGQIRQELLARLESIKLQEVNALARDSASDHHPAVVLVARVEGNRLVLPWETSRAAAEFRTAVGEPLFAAKISKGEAAELVTKNLDAASKLYRDAFESARQPTQAAHARLLLARVLAKSGRRDEALARYRAILQLPEPVIDEHGIPLALYAAERLLDTGAQHGVILDTLQTDVDSERRPSPARCNLQRDLAAALADKGSDSALRERARRLLEKISDRLRDLDQALALEREFPNLGPLRAGARRPEPVWMSFGNPLWLVSIAPPLGRLETTLVAVRGQQVFDSMEAPGRLRFFTDRDTGGELLGESLPGLSVAFVAGDDRALSRRWNLQRSFYLVALALVLGVTLFGAYMLWRDVRRELHLAELRSQFVSSVSHELKTPLTAIRMFAETLRMRRAPDPRAQEEYLETIVNESERLTRLVDNVLDFSKIEQGKKIYHPQPTSLSDVVTAAAKAVQYPLAQQGFSLRVQIEDGLPPVRADRDALELAVLNLLTNAMKYSGDSREIDLRLRTENGCAMIQVTDRGVGIAPEDQPRIFEKFYRVPTHENQLVPGTGLGLTLVDHTVQAHGGAVTVESVPGKGSTFSIRLPLDANGGDRSL